MWLPRWHSDGDRLRRQAQQSPGQFRWRCPYNGAAKGPDLSRTKEVGRYPANSWKLHDMNGNVWEWCLDAYKTELPGGVDPSVLGAEGVVDRVIRGGSWFSRGGGCRSAYRGRGAAVYRVNDLGFRLAWGPSRCRREENGRISLKAEWSGGEGRALGELI